MKRLLTVAAGLAIAVPALGYVKWRRDSAAMTRVIETQAGVALDTFTRDRVSTLPDPVARYFRRVLPEGQPHIRFARLQQEGEFLLGTTWRPFSARQLFSGRTPGFMWDARIMAAPLLPVYVRDSYAGGVGRMKASMLGVYSVVDQADTPELNAGALMRYLAEAAWFPTALLPGPTLAWTPVAEPPLSAVATLTDGALRVSLRFTFTADGDIAEIYAPDRFREANGTYVPTPWRVRALGYDTRQGIRYMSPAEVEWILPDGPQPYWRGRITNATYE